MDNLIELIGVIVVGFAGIITTVTTAVTSVRTRSKFFDRTFGMFDHKIEKIKDTSNTKISNVEQIIDDFVDKTVDRIVSLESKVINQAEKLDNLLVAYENVLLENKAFREIIVILSGTNPELIRSGVASKLKTLNEDFMDEHGE